MFGMNKPLFAFLCVFSLGTAIAVTPAAAQGSAAGTNPDAPTLKQRNAPPAPGQPASPLKTPMDQTSYALGMNLGSGLRRESVEVDADLIVRGLRDALAGQKTLMSEDEERAVLTKLQADVRARDEARRREEADKDRADGDAYRAANKAKEGVVALPSGLQYKILTAGTGPKPTLADKVTCNYRGSLIDGTEFDSSYKHGQPASFPLTNVIKGWTEALQLMPVGSKWQLVIPPDLAYGANGKGPIGPNATLIFEVELLSIEAKQ